MPIDPILQGLLETMRAQPTPPMWQMEPVMARAAFAAMAQALSVSDARNIETRDSRIPGPGGDIPVRIYMPAAVKAQKSAAMIFFHGGGFVIGDLNTHDQLCRTLADACGARLIAVDYRLAPEHKYPAALEDAETVLRHISSHADDFGIDMARIAVGGDSAGGALAALAAQTAAREGIPLRHQLLLFPVTQMAEETPSLKTRAEGYFLERATLDWFYAHYLPKDADRRDPRVSPLFARDLSGMAPAYVMLAGYDPLHDEGLAYAQKLRAAGVAVTVDDYPAMVHDFIYMTAVLPQAREALAKAGAAVKRALTPG